uniref:Uncharacterized protein n=1 Tax=Tetraselmis sp. GSL018 TaxID=582737 RepID=A0A061RTP2_9CHLO
MEGASGPRGKGRQTAHAELKTGVVPARRQARVELKSDREE